MAKLILDAWRRVHGLPNVVYRFLGLTPHSTDASAVTLSLIKQLRTLYALKSTTEIGKGAFTRIVFVISFFTNTDLTNPTLTAYFGTLSPTSGQPLLLVLDSLDQLSNPMDFVDNLPVKLPPNVHCMVTVMKEDKGAAILERVRRRVIE